MRCTKVRARDNQSQYSLSPICASSDVDVLLQHVIDALSTAFAVVIAAYLQQRRA